LSRIGLFLLSSCPISLEDSYIVHSCILIVFYVLKWDLKIFYLENDNLFNIAVFT